MAKQAKPVAIDEYLKLEEVLPALKDLVAKLNDEKNIYALVLTGAGGNFSSGVDLNDFSNIIVVNIPIDSSKSLNVSDTTWK